MVKTLQVSAIPSIRRVPAAPELVLTRTSPLGARKDSYGSPSVWAIVLAGGEGTRLRPLVSRIYGDGRPKQYAALLDSRTLLRQTLDRVGLLVPAERTVIVTMQDHDCYLSAALDGLPRPRVLRQPADRGTAAGVLLPAHWIYARDPHALVVLSPSDHFIGEEAAFMGLVADVVAFVRRHRAWMVLLGAEPTDPETDYGWIEPGERVGWTARGPVYRIRRFLEKPSCEAAGTLLASGGLWNTFVLVASVSALIKAGRECMPDLHERLARVAAFTGTEHEAWAIRQAYTLVPRANFCRSVLGAFPGPLAVAKVPGLTWCDLGSPARVARTLTSLGMSPPWL
jgi:mannose-1-phosphate guanylyltransferase